MPNFVPEMTYIVPEMPNTNRGCEKVNKLNNIQLIFLIASVSILALVAHFIFDINIIKVTIFFGLLFLAFIARKILFFLHTKAYGKKYYRRDYHKKQFRK